MPTPRPHDIDALAGELVRAHPVLPGEQLSRYLQEVVTWNERAGLVSRRSTLQVLGRLVRQSVALWELVAEHRSVTSFVDVGTGGGFPGIIWKLLAPEARGVLVERRQKKAAFLDRTGAVLKLRRLEVFCGDARDAGVTENYRNAFDLGTTFAVATPDDTIPLIRPFLRSNGGFATLAAKGYRPGAIEGLSCVASREEPDGMLVLFQ